MKAQDGEPARPRTKWIRRAVGLLGTAGLLGLLSTQLDAARAWDAMRRADLRWVAAGFVFYLGLIAVRSVRYRLIAPEIPLRVLLAVHGVHVLLLRVMPFRTGELGFAWLMRRAGASGVSRSLVGLLMLRILDVAALLVTFAIGLVAFGQASFAEGHVAVWPALLIGAVALAAPLYLRGALRLGMQTMDGGLRVTGLSNIERVAKLATSVRDAVAWAQDVSMRTLVHATAWTAVQITVNYAVCYAALAALHIEVSLAQTVLGSTGSVLGGLLPLAGVGNFGTLETGWALGFASVGVPRADAVASAFAFSVFSFSYAASTAAAGWGLLPRPVTGTRSPR